MGGEWAEIAFGELLLNGTRNGIYKKKEFHGTGVKIVNMGELFGNPRLSSISMKRVELTSREMERFSLQSGDLLFARRSLVAEGAGKCSIVMEIDEPTTFESSIIRARPDPLCLNSLFAYYLFNSPHGKYLLGTILRHVAVAGITGSDLVKLKIPVPSIIEQRAIAHILGSLDDKIELNRRMNQTLEAMARAIFKSWFVDFDPVRAKAQGRETGLPYEIASLFPDGFQDSELGEIPAGWGVGTLSKIINIIGGGTPKTKKLDYWGGDIPWFSVVDAPCESDVFVIDTEKHITHLGLENSSAKILRKGTTIISARGTVGKCALVGRPMAMNQSCYGLQGKKGQEDYFVYFTIKRQVSDLQRSGHGSVFNTITRDTFNTIRIAIPPNALISFYEEKVQSLMAAILKNSYENGILASLRDTLLPKLISGELRVPDAENFLEEAGV